MIDLEQENTELHVLADGYRQLFIDAEIQLATATDALKAIEQASYTNSAQAKLAREALETIERLKDGAS